MNHRQAHPRRLVHLDDREARRRHFAAMAQRGRIARASVVLPAPSCRSGQRHRPARNSAAMARRETLRRRQIGQVETRLARSWPVTANRSAVVPTPDSEISSIRPPCASINWRASGRPSPWRRSTDLPSTDSLSPSSARASVAWSISATIVRNHDARPALALLASARQFDQDAPPCGVAAMALSTQMAKRPAPAAANRPGCRPADALPRRSSVSLPLRKGSARSLDQPGHKGKQIDFLARHRQHPRFALRQVEHVFDLARKAATPRSGSPRHIRAPTR